MSWHNLFYNSHRLRAGWLLAEWLGLMLAFLLAGIFLTAVVVYVFHWTVSPLVNLYLLISLQAAATLGAIWVLPAGRKIATQLLKYTPLLGQELLLGLLLAFMMLAVIFYSMWNLNWLSVEAVQALPWHYIPLLALIAFYEEFLFRGFILKALTDGAGKWIGLIGSAALFGLAHVINPGSGLAPVLGITAAGLLFGWAYLRTKSLWLPIGLHFGWNFFEGLVFGFPTSGMTLNAVLKLHISGPVLWTGGSFGPEAGLILIPGLLLGALLVWLYTK